MWSSSDSDRDDEHVDTATSSPAQQQPSTPPVPPRRRRQQRARRRAQQRLRAKNIGAGAEEEHEEEETVEAEDVWRGLQQQQQREREAWPRRASRPVVVAGEEDAASAASGESGGMGRARSLTDDDLEELKGCVDLGFGFSYHEIPELCGTLPALELCYSMSQRFLDEHQQLGSKAEEAPAAVAPASPAQTVATNWKISSPGDSPDEVKARLKYWAQAVACTVRLCS